ncbi:hypothetical protein RRG08_042379 [Elysia crispata]|uniref:Uncharacterized protein n=1 Tax=Elysia crispata TaxID=231223 RepID=A0AAE0ZC00_9GAST|nr:hypothetical protein RRG08_042379 [Elysia crispata]
MTRSDQGEKEERISDLIKTVFQQIIRYLRKPQKMYFRQRLYFSCNPSTTRLRMTCDHWEGVIDGQSGDSGQSGSSTSRAKRIYPGSLGASGLGGVEVSSNRNPTIRLGKFQTGLHVLGIDSSPPGSTKCALHTGYPMSMGRAKQENGNRPCLSGCLTNFRFRRKWKSAVEIYCVSTLDRNKISHCRQSQSGWKEQTRDSVSRNCTGCKFTELH